MRATREYRFRSNAEQHYPEFCEVLDRVLARLQLKLCAQNSTGIDPAAWVVPDQSERECAQRLLDALWSDTISDIDGMCREIAEATDPDQPIKSAAGATLASQNLAFLFGVWLGQLRLARFPTDG